MWIIDEWAHTKIYDIWAPQNLFLKKYTCIKTTGALTKYTNDIGAPKFRIECIIDKWGPYQKYL